MSTPGYEVIHADARGKQRMTTIDGRASIAAPAGSIEGSVLVVDDEPTLAGMYAAMLEDDYDVQTATGGDHALDLLTEDVDVVLLDRRMPGLSGDEVLDRVRDRGYDCLVAMVTSVQPELDVLEMAFDAYLVKPVRRQDLRELVRNLVMRSRYSQGARESIGITSKIVALESQYDDEELESDERYRALLERRDRLHAENQERLKELMDRGDTGLVFRDLFGTIRET